MNKKKLLTLSLCLIIATISSLSAQAVGDLFKVGQLYYQITSLSPKEVAVVSGNEKPTGEITIPTTVTHSGTAYSVTKIGESAFTYCTGLTSITIPNSVTNIGNGAFYGCTGLTNIAIPNSVTNIGDQAFTGCSGLTNITIPNSVTNIGLEAFARCTGLTNVTIPNSVTIIGEETFRGCTGLTAIHVDAQNPNYTDIEGVLSNKDKTTLISYPNAKADTYIIPNSVTNIGNGAFSECTGLTNITIPNSVTNIGDRAFWNCTGLTSITIPNSVTNIGDRAFFYCTGLTSITIPNSVTSIGKRTFLGCTGLTSITIPNSVTNIGDRAFRNCKSLTEITIPNSVTNIGYEAFQGCTGLTSITSKIADLSQLTIGSALFHKVDKDNCILYVPKGKVADYQATEQWKEFTNIKEIEGSGISQIDAKRYIALSPNPARDEITISIAPALVEQVSSLTLLDSNGKALQRQAITSSETIIDLTSYTSGIYFVQIDNVVKKLIIK